MYSCQPSSTSEQCWQISPEFIIFSPQALHNCGQSFLSFTCQWQFGESGKQPNGQWIKQWIISCMVKSSLVPKKIMRCSKKAAAYHAVDFAFVTLGNAALSGMATPIFFYNFVLIREQAIEQMLFVAIDSFLACNAFMRPCSL